MSESSPKPAIVVMGVSGSGKSTVGALVAAKVGVPFVDGDDLHSPANVEKMASGTPLTEADRAPWLRTVGETIRDAGAAGTGIVVACSALRRAYRDTILTIAPDTVFIQLTGTEEVLRQRMAARHDHFMPTALLTSQLATLENLQSDEPGFFVDIDAPAAELAERAVSALLERVA